MPDVESKAGTGTPSASHTASQTGARADQAHFAEALQASEELQNVASYGTPGLGATSGFDRIDALLLEEIEAEEVEANSSSQSAAYDGLAPGERLDEQEHAQVHSDPQPTTSADETTYCRHTATLLRKTAGRLSLELISALVTTSPLLVWLVALSEGLLRDGLAEEYGALQLWFRPLYVWCAARVASMLIPEAVTRCLIGSFPRFLLFAQTLSGWPLAHTLGAILSMLAPLTSLDEAAWRSLHGTPRWWQVAWWWLASGLAYVAVVAAARFYISALTSQHYEQRARDAYRAQKVLRKISFAASRVRKTNHQKGSLVTAANAARVRWQSVATEVVAGRNASSETISPEASIRDIRGQAVEVVAGRNSSCETVSPETSFRKGQAVESTTRHDLSLTLAKHLRLLEGPLEFGAGLAQASNLSQARRRAARLFEDLVRFEWLLAAHSTGTEHGAAALSRDELLKWAYDVHGKGRPVDWVGATALFGSAEVIDKDHLISSVERCYKEQRLLTASVATFDRINDLLVRCCAVAWFVTLGFFYLVALGVDFNDLLLPSASLIISVILLMGRAPSDFMSGALYVLMVRPYDIGDRVKLSQPGRASELYSLVIKDIGLLRTHLITSNGELLFIDNAIMRTMTVTNLTRSGPQTLLVQVQVPQTTPAAKMTELVDSIRQYVAEKSGDWSGVDIMFSDTNFEAGHLVVDCWMECVHPAHEPITVFGAKSSFLLFLHAYMQSASIEYVKPVLPVRLTRDQLNSTEV